MRILATALLAAGLAAPFAVGPATATPPHCPPGHAKKGWCAPEGAWRLPPGVAAQRWDGWRRHDLPPPGPGRSYRLLDDELLLVLDATREVLEAIGAIDRATR